MHQDRAGAAELGVAPDRYISVPLNVNTTSSPAIDRRVQFLAGVEAALRRLGHRCA